MEVRVRWEATSKLSMASVSISPVMAEWLRAGRESFMTVLVSGASQRSRKTAESMVGVVVPR